MVAWPFGALPRFRLFLNTLLILGVTTRNGPLVGERLDDRLGEDVLHRRLRGPDSRRWDGDRLDVAGEGLRLRAPASD